MPLPYMVPVAPNLPACYDGLKNPKPVAVTGSRSGSLAGELLYGAGLAGPNYRVGHSGRV